MRVVLILLFGMMSIANGEVIGSERETITVGVRSVPPFAYLSEQGEWRGLSAELWQRLADDAQWKTRWVPLETVQDQVDALRNGTVDVAVGAMSVTPEREVMIDFSHSFHATSLAIATRPGRSGALVLIEQLFSAAFLKAVGALVLLLFVVGGLIWLLERRVNPQFGGSMTRGLGNGFWWSAVTMTTVGYGDKAPVSGKGRLLATVWMFFSVISISGFTAAIASAVTLDRSQSEIQAPQDLVRHRTLAVEGSTAAKQLAEMRIDYRTVGSPEAGLEAIAAGHADAFVYDEAVLRYWLKRQELDLRLLPFPGSTQSYAFGLQEGFGELETVNRRLLELLHGDWWARLREDYLGVR